MKDFQLSFSTLKECKLKLNELFTGNPQGKYRLTLTEWTKKRSISMNAQQHLFYAAIAKAQGDKSPLDVKNMCKDMFGLPILLNSAEHGDKIDFLLHKLDYYKHSYESKMKLIQCLSVTSEFNTSESKQYCDHMIFYFNDLGIPIKYKD
jgi:hypothetical protein